MAQLTVIGVAPRGFYARRSIRANIVFPHAMQLRSSGATMLNERGVETYLCKGVSPRREQRITKAAQLDCRAAYSGTRT